VTAGFEAMVERLGAAGAVIDRGPVPEFAEALEVAGATGGIVSNEAYALWGGLIGEKGDLMFPRIRERFMGGAQFSAADAETARMAFERLSKAFSARAAGYAAVLAPTSPIRPPKVQRLIDEPDFFTQQNMAALRNTRIGNFLKLCALTLPTEADAVGLMLMAPGFNEARLLRLGAAIEVL
jgi:aspartyl-tRNA(Asn)/glutamyl-tRNA(Gln) amidotransferase subunit A